jgi:hypothetical protein
MIADLECRVRARLSMLGEGMKDHDRRQGWATGRTRYLVQSILGRRAQMASIDELAAALGVTPEWIGDDTADPLLSLCRPVAPECPLDDEPTTPENLKAQGEPHVSTR